VRIDGGSMGQADKQSTPKYMCLEANTQYELAQSIDAALAQAEQMVQKDQTQACVHIWIEQVLDGIQEEFAVEQAMAEVNAVQKIAQSLKSLFAPCAAYYQASQGQAGSEEAFRLLLTLNLERSFLNALDMMRARGVWRFDIQRALQNQQRMLLDAARTYRY